MEAYRFAIVTPVYNDWEALRELLRRLDEMASSKSQVRFDVIAVDDGSTAPIPESLTAQFNSAHFGAVDVLHLACNLGHQRAIAIGLAEVDARGCYSAAVVMDSDGEDRPEDLPQLLARFEVDTVTIVVARRARRSEGRLFKTFYLFYRVLFRVLTGRGISFGNFCVLPGQVVSRLVYMPEIWNNLAAAITRSRLPIVDHATARGVRYAGKSKMNMVALFIHGLSALSVYTDVAFTRVLAFSAGLAGLTVLAIAAVLGIRLFTALAIPGWASYMTALLLIVLMQALLLSTGAIFLLLNNRSMPSIVPKDMAPVYVRARTPLIRRVQQALPRAWCM